MKSNQEKASDFLKLFAKIGHIIAKSTAHSATKRYEQCRTGGYTSLSESDDDAMHRISTQAAAYEEESENLEKEIHGLHTSSTPSRGTNL